VIVATAFHGIDARLPQHISSERALKQTTDRGVPEIEAAGIGAEGGQHHARAVRHKAAAAQAAAAARHRGAGMEMAGNLAAIRHHARFVAKHEPSERDLRCYEATKPCRRLGIVIARDPDPVRLTAQRSENRAFAVVEPVGRQAVVKGIAERDHAPRHELRHHGRDPLQGRARVIGRQKLAAERVERSLLEMDIGEDERRLIRPPQGTGSIER